MASQEENRILLTRAQGLYRRLVEGKLGLQEDPQDMYKEITRLRVTAKARLHDLDPTTDRDLDVSLNMRLSIATDYRSKAEKGLHLLQSGTSHDINGMTPGELTEAIFRWHSEADTQFTAVARHATDARTTLKDVPKELAEELAEFATRAKRQVRGDEKREETTQEVHEAIIQRAERRGEERRETTIEQLLGNLSEFQTSLREIDSGSQMARGQSEQERAEMERRFAALAPEVQEQVTTVRQNIADVQNRLRNVTGDQTSPTNRPSQPPRQR